MEGRAGGRKPLLLRVSSEGNAGLAKITGRWRDEKKINSLSTCPEHKSSSLCYTLLLGALTESARSTEGKGGSGSEPPPNLGSSPRPEPPAETWPQAEQFGEGSADCPWPHLAGTAPAQQMAGGFPSSRAFAVSRGARGLKPPARSSAAAHASWWQEANIPNKNKSLCSDTSFLREQPMQLASSWAQPQQCPQGFWRDEDPLLQAHLPWRGNFFSRWASFVLIL